MTLTLSLAYLSVLAHQRSREHQGAALQAQALAIQGLIDPIPAPLPPTRSEVAAAQRNTAVEVAKDRWNHEVENAVRWVQHTDWTEVREGVEAGASRLWTKTFGDAVGETEKVAEDKVAALAKTAKSKTDDAAGGIAAAARGAFDKTKQRGEKLEAAAEETLWDARLRAKSAGITAKQQMVKAEAAVKDTAKDTTTEAKGMFASALEKGKEYVGLAATKAGVAADKVGLKTDGNALPPTDPVERALHQRYEKPEAKHNLTVAEALNERYTPIDKRDNTVLRGL